MSLGLSTPDQVRLELEALDLFNRAEVQAAIEAKRAAFEADERAQTPAGRATLELNLREMAFSAVVSAVTMDVARTTAFWTLNLPHQRSGQAIPGTRHGVDNPDNIYRVIAVDDVNTFRIDGRVVGKPGDDVSFTLFNHYPGSGADSASQGVLILSHLETDADGAFHFTIGPEAADGRSNHLTTTSGQARLIFVRDSLQDWANERPVELKVRRVAGPGAAPLTEAERVREAVAAVELAIDYWIRMMPVWFGTPFNEIGKGRAKNFSYSEQATSEARFRIEEDEALVVTLHPCGARYLGIQAADPWGASIDYSEHTSSLNQHQADKAEDGSITYVLSTWDPGVWNWMDTGGLTQGTLLHRWQGLGSSFDSEGSVRDVRVVKRDRLDDILPQGVRRVSPDERMAQRRTRAENLGRRLA